MAERFFDDEAADNNREQIGPNAVGTGAFRLSAKALLLTYPQCGLAKEAAMELLREKFPPENIIFMIVAQEFHEDGHPHLHALILLRTRCNIRNCRYLDLVEGEMVFHGNYQATRNLRNAIAYVTKDGDVCEHGEIPEHLLDTKKSKREHLDNIVQLTSEPEFLSYVFLNGLSPMIQTLKPLWQLSKKQRLGLNRFERATFVAQPELDALVLSLHEQDQALMIVGPTGVGKTQYILALLADRALHRLTELDELRAVSTDASVLLFDDCELEKLGRGPLLHLLDVKTERSIKCRYSNATILPSQMVILIGNSPENILGRFCDDAAVQRRIRTFQLGPDKLFA